MLPIITNGCYIIIRFGSGNTFEGKLSPLSDSTILVILSFFSKYSNYFCFKFLKSNYNSICYAPPSIEIDLVELFIQ